MLLVCAAALAAACGAGSATTASPRPPKLVDWCVTKAEKRAAVRFRATDGARLVGVLVGPRAARAGIVFAHEAGESSGLCNWLPYGRTLARAGYRVLAFDARGSFSSPPFRAAPFRRDHDVAGAVAELRRRGVERIVLVGGSLGAMASIVAGATVEPAVMGVVAVSPGLEFFGLDALAAAPKLRAPALIVAAKQDGEFPRYARTLYDAVASPEKRLLILPGPEHGFELVWQYRARRARPLLDAFIRERLQP